MTNVIESIQGTPLDPLKEYLVALPLEWMDLACYASLDFFQPLFQWLSPQKLTIHKETAQASHLLLAQALCRTMWFQPGSLLDVRAHGGKMSQEQAQSLVRAQIVRTNGGSAAITPQVQNEVSRLVAEQIMTLTAWDKSDDSEQADSHERVGDAVLGTDGAG